MSDSGPAGASPTAQKRRWPRLRVPTPLVATFVGIALTAWLLPAFTRQWDDRQKEHEFKATIVDDMASATARALVGAEAIWSKKPFSQKQRMQLADAWSLSALEMEARLRSYFPSDVVASWQLYTWMVDRFIDGHRNSAAADLRDVRQKEARFDPEVADAAARLLVYGNRVTPPAPRFVGDSPAQKSEVAWLDGRLAPEMRHYEKSLKSQFPVPGYLPYTWRVLESMMLRLEQAMADQALGSHAVGYSTTFGNLMDDLTP